jgi:hypothetical protein
MGNCSNRTKDDEDNQEISLSGKLQKDLFLEGINQRKGDERKKVFI